MFSLSPTVLKAFILIRVVILSQWVVLVLYGFTGALFSYCISLIVTSPLAAFATAAGYQFLISIVSTRSISLFLAALF